MQCKLCGLPTPKTAIEEGGHSFCCLGCREVYRCFGADIFAARQRAVSNTIPEPQGEAAYLWVEGMHCASCEILVEKITQDTPGVLATVSNYATSTAKITYDPKVIAETELPALLNRSGYRARLRDAAVPEYDERPDLLRLLSGGSLASIVMMLAILFIYPIHAGLAERADYEGIHWLAFGLAPTALLLLTTIVVFYVGLPILRGAWIGIRVGLLNTDCLLALSILSAYGYSIVQLFYDPIDLYFEVASTLVVVLTAGRYLEQKVRVRATHALKTIMQDWSPKARVRRDSHNLFLRIEELLPGERVFVHQGEAVPVDGYIVAGRGAIDESLMTGEPFPELRLEGQKVYGGSIVREGNLEIEIGPRIESRIANLADILWNMQSSGTGIQSRIDRLSRFFVPAVLALAGLVGSSFYLSGGSLEDALLASLATLIVSCPCTFGLAIPLTTAAAISSALNRGIIVTKINLFEQPTSFDVVAIDKTGTLSSGEMVVSEVIGPSNVASVAAAVEKYSPHPVARAIAQLPTKHSAGEVRIHPGRGALACVGGRRVAVGSRTMFDILGWEIPDPLKSKVEQHHHGEGVVSFVGWEGCAEGAILTRDSSRPGWERITEKLRESSRVVLLTGAEHSDGYQLHTDEVHAGVPPEAKAAVIRQLKGTGRVVMVGDGSNDAPALAEADLGIAFGAPTTLAAEAADIVIPGNHLERVLDVFELVRTTRSRIKQNLGWALAYNGVAVPLAMAGYLNPMAAALAMSMSSILVVVNASRPMFRVDVDQQRDFINDDAVSRIRFSV